MSERDAARVRVVIVEESIALRTALARCLEAEDDIEVVGQASGAREATELVARLRPDVVTVDLFISDGGGQYAIEQIMGYSPTPVLVLSADVSGRHSARAVAALMAGALDAMPKPARWTTLEEAEVRRRVRMLRGTPVIRHLRGRLQPRRVPPQLAQEGDRAATVVAIAASAGGPAALAEVISGLGGIRAPVLVVQHIHPDFVVELATSLERLGSVPVHVVEQGEQLEAGVVYLAPGGSHLRIAANLRAVLDPLPATLHRPSADELFLSLANRVGKRSAAALLTGMGDDGAKGLLAIRDRGGFTIAQDAATSAVYGMPRVAQLIGAACLVLPLNEIASALVAAASGVRP